MLFDIIRCEAEASFSTGKSPEEIKSRLDFQKEQIHFLNSCSSKFGKILNEKVSDLIEDSWSDEETIMEQKKKIEKAWRQIKNTVSALNKEHKKRAQSIRTIMYRKSNAVYLQVQKKTPYADLA